jgi:HEPN domain-containing protein
MNATTNVIRLVREWIEKAEEDLLTAQVLMSTSENRPVNNVCFHAQQCVEKYIKALLISLSINFPKVSPPERYERQFELISRKKRSTDRGFVRVSSSLRVLLVGFLLAPAKTLPSVQIGFAAPEFSAP